MERKKKLVTFAPGRSFCFETGKIAKQANGAVLVQAGETIVFATACSAPSAEEPSDFVRLKVDYQEKFFSAGKTLGGFIKREGRPSEREILVSRLIDRPLRPLFQEGYYDEIQVLAYVWSYDGVHQPDPLAICAASAALTLSDIPLLKPVGAVRVGKIKDTFVINPTAEEMSLSSLDLVLAGTEEAILMIEGYADFLAEEQILSAIAEGHRAIGLICRALSEWQRELGKPKNTTLRLLPEGLLAQVEKQTAEALKAALRLPIKLEREKALQLVEEAVMTALSSSKDTTSNAAPLYTESQIKSAFKQISSKYMRRLILDEGIRADGRTSKEIRPIDIETGLLPRTHGSCLFTRGETQTMAVCTLGGEGMGQRFEDLNGEGINRFYLHYFFPPFSVGEVGRVGPPGRRELGHGKLAERALQAIIPSLDKFPYTIRLESNITESNGSSSMVSVKGGCLALMDAGVPVKCPVAGIAMGLIMDEESGKWVVLSDILGMEDGLGDMDFKVTGSQEGITAFQMDIKIEGITLEIMRAALAQAQEGLLFLLDKMHAALPAARTEMSIYAPRIETVRINPSKIATIIGPGGKQIKQIIEETHAEIHIDDSGLISIASNNPQSMARAKEIIESLIGEVEIGKTYQGKVTSVVAFGVFVEILPGKEGLCHISELAEGRITNIFEYIKPGDQIAVKVLDINERGQLKLSRKATVPAPHST